MASLFYFATSDLSLEEWSPFASKIVFERLFDKRKELDVFDEQWLMKVM